MWSTDLLGHCLVCEDQQALLRTVLVLAHGVPSHDTFSRVFRMLDPQAFEKAFRRFMRAFAEATEGVVALDGKALRRAYESGKSRMPPIMVTAWSAQTRMALANVLAAGNNEAAAALQLIGLLTLKGCVVTADALHCHRAMAQAIVERHGDYALAVKNNQPALLRDAQAAVAAATRKGASATVTADECHGRNETRVAVVAAAADMAERHGFPGLQAVAQIKSKRGRDKTVERYFLLSRHYRPPEVLRIVRQQSVKTAWFGHSMCFSTKTWRAVERTMPRPISPSCAASHSTSRAPIPTPKLPCAATSNAQDGTMPSSSICSATCDSPGGGRRSQAPHP